MACQVSGLRGMFPRRARTEMSAFEKWAILMVTALFAATLAAVTGFGGTAVLLPVLVSVFGIRAAVPILTVAQLIGNGSRVWFNRAELRWKVVAWFALGGIPAALIGGYLFAAAPLAGLTRLLGAFLLLVVVWRHVRPQLTKRFPTPVFAGIGAGASFLSALMGSVGAIMAPFFLAYGLVKGSYIGTEALSTVVMHVFKLIAYGQTAVLTAADVWAGLALGPVMIAGSFLGKRIVDRVPEKAFVWIIEAVLVIAGLVFLIFGEAAPHL
jgi:uncharacterized membrane protein YfcA